MSTGSNFSVFTDLKEWLIRYLLQHYLMFPYFSLASLWRSHKAEGANEERLDLSHWVSCCNGQKCTGLPGNTFLFSSTIMASSCIPHFCASTRCLKPGVCLGTAKGHYGLFCGHSGEIHMRETSLALTSPFSCKKKTNNAFGPQIHTGILPYLLTTLVTFNSSSYFIE